MRPEVKRWFKIVFCTLMVVFSVSIVFSDWVYPDNSGDKTTGNGEQPTLSEEIPVAYLLSDPTRTYSKVEDAINKANLSSTKEVVVPILTAKSATITKNVTIKSNVTLNIPYEVNAEGVPTVNAAKASVQDGSTFVSNSSAVFTLNISPNVTLTNYGTIEIGGVLGSGGGGANASGQTCGAFSKIELDSNSCIDNYNLLFCYGLITEKTMNNASKIICEESGRIDEPFIVRDFKGGSATYAAYSNSGDKYSPFNLFEMRNIFPTVKYKSGAQLKGWANLYANDDFQAMTFDVIGSTSSSIIEIVSGSYLDVKYVSSNGQYTTEGYCKLDFYGSVNVNSLSFNFKAVFSINVSTSKGFFPISYLLQINFHALESQSCIVNTGNQGFKIMPGSSLIVDKGVTLITSEVIIYPQGQVNQVGSQTYKKTELPDVKINGVLAATAIGGQIDVENEGSVLTRSNGNALTSYEIVEVGGKSIFTSIKSKQTFTQQLSIRLIKNNVVSDAFENVDGKKYLSRTISSKSGYDEYTESFPIAVKYIAGANAKNATIEKAANLYDVHSMLSEKDLNSFINTGYMIENFTAYTDGTSSNPLTINTGNSVFLSEYVFSDIKETKTLYIKVNCVEYKEITINYQTEWGRHKYSEKIKYSLNDISRLYRLKTTSEMSFDLGSYWVGGISWENYIFQNYELYPGVPSKTGTPAMTIEEEGTTVDLNSEQLKSAWDNSCMFVYVNRKRQ